MAKMLEMAFHATSELPDTEQNPLAEWLLDEIESDRKRDSLFFDSEDVLGQMSLDALAKMRVIQ